MSVGMAKTPFLEWVAVVNEWKCMYEKNYQCSSPSWWSFRNHSNRHWFESMNRFFLEIMILTSRRCYLDIVAMKSTIRAAINFMIWNALKFSFLSVNILVLFSVLTKRWSCNECVNFFVVLFSAILLDCFYFTWFEKSKIEYSWQIVFLNWIRNSNISGLEKPITPLYWY